MNDATGMPQSAVVIGGTSEIAGALLQALVRRRLRRVVLAGRDEQALAKVAAHLQAAGAEQATVMAFDVTEVAGHAAFAREAARALGQVDMVLVAAGILGEQSESETDPEAAARVLTTNQTGPAAAMVAFAAMLRRQGHGRIVVLSSVAGIRVRRANFVYGASKAGLDGFAQGLSDSLAGSGVSVTIVRPGFVRTRMTAGMDPAPLATTAEAVAADIVRALERGSPIVWSPPAMRWIFAVLRVLPRSLWRRIPG